MIALITKKNRILTYWKNNKIILGRITANQKYPKVSRHKEILLLREKTESIPRGFAAVLIGYSPSPTELSNIPNIIQLDMDAEYLVSGDIIRINPVDSSIKAIYRGSEKFNSYLLTERCNSFCLMCSQPPRQVDDRHLADELLAIIPLIDKNAKEICLTGGEPTLVGEIFFEILSQLKNYLPNTAVHVLSNGRNFSNLELAKSAGRVNHPDLMYGIPLYSDIASVHDFVVQSKGAYDETIRGILNLKRCRQKVEVRIVVHQQTYKRLPELAEFITRNLVFVDHVTFMGLEMTGFTKANMDVLWIDPSEYSSELRKATNILSLSNIRTSIYNHQLCVLDEELHRYCVKSISDWKNEYLVECESCALKSSCGGFFSSSVHRHSKYIKAIPFEALSPS